MNSGRDEQAVVDFRNRGKRQAGVQNIFAKLRSSDGM